VRYLALLFVLFLAAGSAGTASGATFKGVYASTPFLDSTKKNLPDSVYQSAVFGVYIRLEWSVIEPTKGKYDWSTLDAETSRAISAGKQISVGVTTGENTPGWLFNEGVQYGTFVVNDASSNCLTLQIAVPWDATYQQEYAAMLSALAAHLQSTSAYNAVQVVKITPMTEWTEEMRLPSDTGPKKSGGCRRVSNAVAIWQSLGYRPHLAYDAWTEAAQSVQTAFPDKVLGIAILNDNDFPLIDENGDALKSEKSAGWVDVKGEIISYGVSTFPLGFLVGWNALGQTETSSVVIDAGAAGAIEGWQTNMHLNHQAGCDSSSGHDNAPCTDATYQDILDNGIANGGQYLEIWPDDLLAFPDAVAEAQRKL